MAPLPDSEAAAEPEAAADEAAPEAAEAPDEAAASTSEPAEVAEADAAAAVWETPGIGAVVYAPPGAAVPDVMM